MEIRNLITFARIAEVRSFSKTAEQLGYSQSAVTMQIKQLEAELHTPLFERLGKQVRLTQAGEQLLPHALTILDSVRKAERIAQAPGQLSGKLRIGTSESYVISVFPPIMMEFNRRCPKVEVCTRMAQVQDLFQMLRQNDVDLLYFLDQRRYFPEWVKVLERPERIFFVAASDSPLAKEKRIPVERLLEEPMYLTGQGNSYRCALEQLLWERGYELHPVWEVGSTDVITRFLLRNQGISFLPEYVVREELAAGRLAALDTECPEVILWSQLVYHRKKSVSPQMERLIEVMVKHLQPPEL